MNLTPTVKTTLFLAGLTAVLIITGYFISGWGGALTFLFLGIVLNAISYWFSDKIALTMAGAHQIFEDDAPAIFADVKELSTKMGLPMPRIYMTADMQPNAFATGRNPKNSAICITQGLTRVLNNDEVRGVIAHELGHIKSRDVLIATIAAVVAGAVSSIAQIGLFFGNSDDERGNVFVDILLMIFAPIAALIIQLAISRQREFAADAISAKYTGQPGHLADALIKIDQMVGQIPYVDANPALASLYIQHPFRGGSVLEWLSTHPSTAKRVEKLMEMK